MLSNIRRISPENLWNRLARGLIHDSKQVLLYCGIRIPEKKQQGEVVDYSDIIERITKGTNDGAIYDPTTSRIYFEPEYIQNILDKATRFNFPVHDRSFGPGGIAGFIHEQDSSEFELKTPTLNHVLQQGMIANKSEMPFGFICARRLAHYEVDQFSVMTKVHNAPTVFNVMTEEGIKEAEKYSNNGHYIITNHTILDSPLTLSSRDRLDVFVKCVEKQIPVMLTTQPFSGQNAPMTAYGLALLSIAEFMVSMAIAYAIHPETQVVNGAYPTMCTPGVTDAGQFYRPCRGRVHTQMLRYIGHFASLGKQSIDNAKICISGNF